MTLQVMEGFFDANYEASTPDWSAGTLESSDVPYPGAGAFTPPTGTNLNLPSNPSGHRQERGHVRLRMKIDAYQNDSSTYQIFWRRWTKTGGNSGEYIDIRVNPNGEWAVYWYNNVQNTFATNPPAGTWFTLEWSWQFTGSTAATMYVWLDGEEVWSGSLGAQRWDTDNAHYITMNSNIASTYWRVSDLFVWDEYVTTPLGDIRIAQEVPTGDGTFNEWSGTYADVDDADPSTSTGTSISANTAETTQTFTYPSFPGSPNVIGVKVDAWQQGTGGVDTVFRSGTDTYSLGHDLDLPATYDAVTGFPMATNPATGNAWTFSEVNSGQFGVGIDVAPDVSFVASEEVAGGGLTYPQTINKPTGTVDDDLMIMMITTRNFEPTLISGWTELYGASLDNSTVSVPPTNNERVHIWYKIASSEGASYDIAGTDGGSDSFVCHLATFRNTDGIREHRISPYNHGNTGELTELPNIRAYKGDALVGWIGTCYDTDASFSTTPPTGMTLIEDSQPNVITNNAGAASFYQIMTSAGETGAKSVSATNFSQYGHIHSIVLKRTGSAWNPDQLDNQLGWYDYTNMTAGSAGSEIDEVTDRWGGFAPNSATGDRPQWILNQINSRDVADYSGGEHWHFADATELSPVNPSAPPTSFWAVFYIPSTSVTTSEYLIDTAESTDVTTALIHRSSDNLLVVNNGGTAVDVTNTGSAPSVGWHYLIYICNSDGTLDSWWDGSAAQSGAGAIGTRTPQDIIIGRRRNDQTNDFQGYIAEIGWVDDALTSAEVDLLNAYLETKYNL